MANVSPAQIQERLGGIDYPASKQDLIEHARKGGKDDEVVQVLNKLKDKVYNSPVDVTKEIGKVE